MRAHLILFFHHLFAVLLFCFFFDKIFPILAKIFELSVDLKHLIFIQEKFWQFDHVFYKYKLVYDVGDLTFLFILGNQI